MEEKTENIVDAENIYFYLFRGVKMIYYCYVHTFLLFLRRSSLTARRLQN